MRNIYLLLCCLTAWLCAPGWVSAQNAAAPAITFMVRERTPDSMTVEQVAASAPGMFTRFNPGSSYSIDPAFPLWLHFRLAVEPGTVQTGWTFELAKPLLNCVEFYYRNAQGGWQVQKSGISVPHALWPQHGLHPQFQLPLLAPGVHDFYVKVARAFCGAAAA
jgi:7TMR-DISM extracellular 2